MRIGELAKTVGINQKTIRYYEDIGLMPPAPRSAGGYRQYGDTTRERLTFIVRAKAIGLSLAEIKEILTLRDDGACPCGHVVRLLDRKLDAIAERMRQLADMQRELASLRAGAATTPPNGGGVCSIIEHHSLAAGLNPTPAPRLPLSRGRSGSPAD